MFSFVFHFKWSNKKLEACHNCEETNRCRLGSGYKGAENEGIVASHTGIMIFLRQYAVR